MEATPGPVMGRLQGASRGRLEAPAASGPVTGGQAEADEASVGQLEAAPGPGGQLEAAPVMQLEAALAG